MLAATASIFAQQKSFRQAGTAQLPVPAALAKAAATGADRI